MTTDEKSTDEKIEAHRAAVHAGGYALDFTRAALICGYDFYEVTLAHLERIADKKKDQPTQPNQTHGN